MVFSKSSIGPHFGPVYRPRDQNRSDSKLSFAKNPANPAFSNNNLTCGRIRQGFGLTRRDTGRTHPDFRLSRQGFRQVCGGFRRLRQAFRQSCPDSRQFRPDFRQLCPDYGPTRHGFRHACRRSRRMHPDFRRVSRGTSFSQPHAGAMPAGFVLSRPLSWLNRQPGRGWKFLFSKTEYQERG